MSSESEFFKEGDGSSKTLVVSFGGCITKPKGYVPFEFLNFLNKNFPEIDCGFYVDLNKSWYSKGIAGISEDVPSTVAYLEEKVKGYDKVIFLGVSAGGYASLLFSSLVKGVTHSIAFDPQTDVEDCGKNDVIAERHAHGLANLDKRYGDIIPHLSDTVEYNVYARFTYRGDGNWIHRGYHSERLIDLKKKNIFVHRIKKDITGLRDSGELLDIITKHVTTWFLTTFII